MNKDIKKIYEAYATNLVNEAVSKNLVPKTKGAKGAGKALTGATKLFDDTFNELLVTISKMPVNNPNFFTSVDKLTTQKIGIILTEMSKKGADKSKLASLTAEYDSGLKLLKTLINNPTANSMLKSLDSIITNYKNAIQEAKNLNNAELIQSLQLSLNNISKIRKGVSNKKIWNVLTSSSTKSIQFIKWVLACNVASWKLRYLIRILYVMAIPGSYIPLGKIFNYFFGNIYGNANVIAEKTTGISLDDVGEATGKAAQGVSDFFSSDDSTPSQEEKPVQKNRLESIQTKPKGN